METYYEIFNIVNFINIKNNRLKSEILFFSTKQNLAKYISNHELSFLGSINSSFIDSFSANYDNIINLYLEGVYEIYKMKRHPVNNIIYSNSETKLFYQNKVNFDLFIYKNRYHYQKLNISFYFYESYPFTTPKVEINNSNRKINYKELITNDFFPSEINQYLSHKECIDSSKMNNLILYKYLKLGFKSCPCCESLFFNSNNFSPCYTICNYFTEICRVLIMKINYEKLICIKIIMLKYLGFELESIYEYLVGVLFY